MRATPPTPSRSEVGSPREAARLAEVTAYTRSSRLTPTDLRLDGNEGQPPTEEQWRAMLDQAGPELLRRYPDVRPLEEYLAGRHGVSPEQVLVTAGGDESIDRVCRAFLEPGREIVLPMPTFVMLPRYARLAGATPRTVPWPDGPYPIDAVLAATGPQTGVVAVVTPNNPTGAVATAANLERLSAALPHAVLLVDLAYVEFADEDLTATVLRLPNAVAVRTHSKAWGLAGLRLGYALGPASIIAALRRAGSPYPVSGLALAFTRERLARDEAEMAAVVARVKEERATLTRALRELGADPVPSQANFVYGRFCDAEWVHDGLAGLGIAVRAFGELPGALRITLPGCAEEYDRLESSLRSVLAPEALLFDLDGVLADVSGSYRAAILRTAESYGITLEAGEIAAAKAEGNANNDWELTRRLLERRGVKITFEQSKERFEGFYQGTPDAPGLRRTERLIPPRKQLEALAEKLPLGIVTGRPRRDAERFLEEAGVADLLMVVVCLEDGPLKPDPAPVRIALERLGVRRAWLVGDTVDDVRAARGASVVPLGVVAPGDDGEAVTPNLLRAGAARVLTSLDELGGLLS